MAEPLIQLRENPRRLSVESKKTLAVKALNKLNKAMPDAQCELYHETPYQLLVSVVLSAQATDKSVNKSMEPLHKKGLTPHMVLRWGEQKFLEKIRHIGLAPTKARNVLKLSKIIVNEHNGEVPHSREDLESLPGVGRKTANVILAEVFGEPTLAVDTHVFRVSRRLGLHDANTADKCEQQILKVIPKRFLPKAHHLLILHGRYTCKARQPQCEDCHLLNICPSIKQ